MLNECGICRQKRDQHLLTKCDTCYLYYHLNCLNPPLTRLPKKSKLYGWQCSECDKTSDSEIEEVKTPRRSKSRYSREARSDPEMSTPKLKIKPVEPEKPKQDENQDTLTEVVVTHTGEMNGFQMKESKGHVSKSGKKRRREKHKNRYSPELGSPMKEHKRKRKKKSFDLDEPMPHPRITIKVIVQTGQKKIEFFVCRSNPFRCQRAKWRQNRILSVSMYRTTRMTTVHPQFRSKLLHYQRKKKLHRWEPLQKKNPWRVAAKLAMSATPPLWLIMQWGAFGCGSNWRGF